jgi:hypothetical protein
MARQIKKRPKTMLMAEPPSLVLGLIPTQRCPVNRRILLPELLIVLMALVLTGVNGIGAVRALTPEELREELRGRWADFTHVVYLPSRTARQIRKEALLEAH